MTEERELYDQERLQQIAADIDSVMDAHDLYEAEVITIAANMMATSLAHTTDYVFDREEIKHLQQYLATLYYQYCDTTEPDTINIH